MPEKNFLRVGIMPLADSAPIVVAQAKGFFARHGLEVEIALERAWAAVRDKLVAERLDAAQLLAPMPLAATLGLDAVQVPMLTALTLNLNGNSIVVANALHGRLQALRRPDEHGALGWAQALRRVIEVDRASGRPSAVFAHVYPFSTHNYELRYWLACAGIRPDHDLNLIAVPPPQAVAQLEAGRIDGFCVGAPWAEVAETLGLGRRIVSSFQIWNNSPEKVLGVTRAWAQAHPATHLALVAAIIEANRWLDRAENRAEAARLLGDGRYIDAPPACIAAALQPGAAEGEFGPGLVFDAGAAGFPWVSQAQWFLQQMRRWHALPADADCAAVAAAVYRPDLYRLAAQQVGAAAPREDRKSEGTHAAAWTLGGSGGTIAMGPDRFVDGAVFAPT
ncbi:MAG: ABC transporter substrate-binding protein [Nevskia sp.]|nr:ABC transporter substrate-binding protein [Nevskia sp.]